MPSRASSNTWFATPTERVASRIPDYFYML